MPQKQTGGNVVVTQASQPSENKKLILALSAIVLTIMLTALDQTVVSPAMPRIVEELQGFSLFAWVTTVYLLTSTATIPIAGKLGDIFGRKPLLIIAVLIFLVGSALSGAAPTMLWLVIFRGLQGIGAGALQANAFAMIAELFPDSAKRARWQGFIAGIFGVASVIGPALGGFITDNLAWHWIFYVNVPVGIVAIPALIFNLPYNKGRAKRSIDWWGATTITGAVVSLLLALTWGGQPAPRGYAWDSPQIIGLFVSTVVLTALFIWIETKATEPIVPLQLFRLRVMGSVTVVSFSIGAVMLGALLFIPLFVQVIQGQSASSSGAITTPLALAMVVANIFTGQFIGRIGILKLPMISGALFTTIGVGLLTLLDAYSSPWEVTIFMIVIGLGIGQVMPGMTIAVQESVPRRDLGAGISSVQFFRSIGSTVGVALIGTIVTNSYVSNINSAPEVQGVSPQLLQAIQEPQNLINKQIAATLPPELVGAVHQALATAIHSGFLIALGVCLAIMLAVFTIPAIRITSGLKSRATQTKTETLTSEAVAVRTDEKGHLPTTSEAR
ncbi:MAG: MDR family MFS transporter [Chloroflexota bacterium]